VANKHPARYSDALLPVMAAMLRGCQCVLDPFAGTGRIHDLEVLLPGCVIIGNELEFEWAAWRPGRMAVGNALRLPFADGTFDGICVSPTYGNRLADDRLNMKSRGFSYDRAIKRRLHPDNAGQLQWGNDYRDFHLCAWTEARRVLCPGGRLVLNVKDHIRDGARQRVTDWHIGCLEGLGFTVVEHVHVDCPGLRVGRNAEKRVDYESVLLLVRAA